MSKTNEAKILLMTGGLIAKDLCELLTNVTEIKISATTLHNRKRSAKYELLNTTQRESLRKIIANPQTEDEMIFAESMIASHKYLTMLTSEAVMDEEEQIELDDNDLEIGEGDASELDVDLDESDSDELDIDDDLELDESDSDELDLDEDTDELDNLLGSDEDSLDDLLGEPTSSGEENDDLDLDIDL